MQPFGRHKRFDSEFSHFIVRCHAKPFSLATHIDAAAKNVCRGAVRIALRNRLHIAFERS